MKEGFENIDDNKMKELIIEYIEGNLHGELKEYIQLQIEKNEKARSEYMQVKKVLDVAEASKELTPDQGLREEFSRILEDEKSKLQPDKTSKEVQMDPFWNLNTVLKIAAGLAILAIGFLIGLNISNQNQDELEALRKEMEATKKLVMDNLQQESASKRILAVTTSSQVSGHDPEIIEALIHTMEEDPNVNVRLAAVNALAKFEELPEVKNSLINALKEQKNPIVQIELINIMVHWEEKRALENLQKLVDDDLTIPTVKDQAQMGIFKLM